MASFAPPQNIISQLARELRSPSSSSAAFIIQGRSYTLITPGMALTFFYFFYFSYVLETRSWVEFVLLWVNVRGAALSGDEYGEDVAHLGVPR